MGLGVGSYYVPTSTHIFTKIRGWKAALIEGFADIWSKNI